MNTLFSRFCRLRFLAGLVLGLSGEVAPLRAVTAELVDHRKIWDAGAHNAFTDLIRWHDRWWCTFRESEGHVGGDGGIRILTSADGAKWEAAALLTEKDVDLRDPKLTVTPDGKLMLNCGGLHLSWHESAEGPAFAGDVFSGRPDVDGAAKNPAGRRLALARDLA
jgi:hypothetical protein